MIADLQKKRISFAVEHGFAHEGLLMSANHHETSSARLESAKDTAQRTCQSMAVDGFDVVLECTGAEEATQTAIYVCSSTFALSPGSYIQAARSGGKIVLIGMGNPVQSLPISAAALGEVDIIGTFRYADTYPEAIGMLANPDPDLPPLSRLITHRFSGLDKVEAAFRMASRTQDENGNLVLKVIVEGNETHQG